MTGRAAPRWNDLRKRTASGLVMLAAGALAIWAGAYFHSWYHIVFVNVSLGWLYYLSIGLYMKG